MVDPILPLIPIIKITVGSYETGLIFQRYDCNLKSCQMGFQLDRYKRYELNPYVDGHKKRHVKISIVRLPLYQSHQYIDQQGLCRGQELPLVKIFMLVLLAYLCNPVSTPHLSPQALLLHTNSPPQQLAILLRPIGKHAHQAHTIFQRFG